MQTSLSVIALSVFDCFCTGADSRFVADVCLEAEVNLAECDNTRGFYNPEVPPGVTYESMCFENDRATAEAVQPSELHGVRCISESTQYGYSLCEKLPFEDALSFCEHFEGDPNVTYTRNLTDWKLPSSPREAGLACGSGCQYDTSDVWVTYGAFLFCQFKAAPVFTPALVDSRVIPPAYPG